ncbi:MAG TPA: glycoside hydrolase family 3 C-terminal domain-containing protein [Verrucomicrobiae bacterium]|nr:glycoside hydrolase family 3 C-terminal domain-containing protein [Verrucomicrobiae bacterium]
MTSNIRFHRFSPLVILLLAGPVVRAQSQTSDLDVRARALVSQMTLQEKITELHGIQNAEHKRYVPPIPRLGIPGFRIANGPCGVGPGDEPHQLPATALPAPILLAATWDPGLARGYGVIIGLEARDLGDDLLEGPDVNIARVPQNGRTFEAFGEDPYLVARMAVNEIEGIQSQGEIANVKHYAANNQETDRFAINEIVPQRALREIYLPAFEASVKQGQVASVMAAYPRINGEFCCANKDLESRILKDEWGFQGFITSDFGAVHSTVPSALAGLDLEMPTGKYFGSALEQAVESGQVPMSVIDEKLVRRFRTMMQYGLFDNPPAPKSIPVKEDGAESCKIAEEGMVLLKNDNGELPLNPDTLHRIALIGPYAAKAMTGGGGSSHVIPLYTVNPADGLQQRAGTGIQINFDGGTNITHAVALAKSADVAIVMVGDRESEGHDHPLALAGNQDELVEAVAAANPHTIVVLKTGSAVFMPWVDQVRAILEAWYPGEEDGNAVAAVLFGDVNPSGKLPITFPKQLADLPANTPEQYPGVNGVVHYSEGIFVGYRHYDAKNIQPLFPFGYGLSYTAFGYKNLGVSTDKISLKENSSPTVAVDFDVTNTGQRAGEEIAELYVGLPSTSEIAQPPKQLEGFSKIALAPGETRHVQLQLDARALSYWNTANHDWEILPGTYRVMAGGSSRDLPLQGAFTVSAD